MKKLLLTLLYITLPCLTTAQDIRPSAADYNVEAEEAGNPLVLIQTSMGDIVLELFPNEAPATVDNFIGLAEGSKPFIDPATGQEVSRPFYDGLIFHRVIEGFMIQGGSPSGDGGGGPGYTIADEINARSLGLDRIPAVDEEGYPHESLRIASQQDFQAEVLGPLYADMGIEDQSQLTARADEIVARIQALTLMDVYELQGYHYSDNIRSRAPVKGIISMANAGPDSAGSQFFITLADTPWLTGKFTVFGKVRSGMEVLEEIGQVATNASDRPLSPITIERIRPLSSPPPEAAPEENVNETLENF